MTMHSQRAAAGVQFAVLLFGNLACQQIPPPKRDAAVKERSTSGSPASKIIVGSGIGGPLSGGEMIHYVRPIYPMWARKQRLQGVVEFTATIGKDGRIRELSFVKGPAPLVPYAERAVRQWRYKPTLLNGVRMETKTDVLVQFTLNQ